MLREIVIRLDQVNPLLSPPPTITLNVFFNSYLFLVRKKRKKDRFIWLYRLFNSFVERLLAHFTTLFNLLLESEQKKTIKTFGNLISSNNLPICQNNQYL